MAHTHISGKRGEWYHFHPFNESDLAFLHNNFKFHPLDYEDIRSDAVISKLDTYKHYVFGVFHVPRLDTETGRVYGEALFVFVSQDKLVTISKRPIPALERMREHLQSHREKEQEVIRRGPAFLMYNILQDAFEDAMPIVTNLTTSMDYFEEEIHAGHGRRVTVDIGRARRNALFIRHIVDPQRRMMSTLASMKRYFLPPELEDYFDDLRDTLNTMWMTANNLKLIIDGLFDVNEAMMTHKTNRIVTLLTIFSVSLAGPTLVAGFYGMNASWLPKVEDPTVIAMIYFFSFTIVLAIVGWAVRRKPVKR